jgi:1-acyl-sn-glycerol-3-phosphate acyltransferase
VPAVPVWIEGTFESWPPRQRLPRPHPVSIRIGPALALADLEPDGAEGERHRRIAERLRAKVEELAREEPARNPRPAP